MLTLQPFSDGNFAPLVAHWRRFAFHLQDVGIIARLGHDNLTSYSMLLLIAINLFNYIDRQVLAAVEPEIRKELESGMRAAGLEISEADSKWQMGLLSTAFLVSYMLLAPLFGWLADRFSRWM